MTKGAAHSLDENTRRYYLDAMGIQCWESIAPQQAYAQTDNVVTGGVSSRDAGTIDLAQLEDSVQQCTKCQLHNTRKQALAGRGKQSADLMFVVLSPSASDDENAVICSGEAGALFSKMLTAIDIDIDDVYISSLLKCSVPMNYTVSPQDLLSCNGYLEQQIQFVQPELIIVLGEVAARCLLQKDLSIDDYRAMNDGMQAQVASVPLFFSYSPEELLLQPASKRKAWSDLQQLQKIIDKKK